MYINELLSEWNTNNTKVIQQRYKQTSFSEDQVITAESETLLQKSIYRFEIKYQTKQKQN
jgi:hypothetical protein